MSTQAPAAHSPAPVTTVQQVGAGFSFPTFLGGLVLGLVIGMFIAAYALPIIEPMLGTGPARTGATSSTPAKKEPRDPQPEPAAVPVIEPKATEPGKAPEAPAEKPVVPAPAVPDATPKTAS